MSEESRSESRIESIPFTHTWVLRNFKITFEEGGFTEFTQFCSEDFAGGDFKWKLSIDAYEVNNFNLTGLFLCFLSSPPNNKKVHVKWNISLLDKNEKLLKLSEIPLRLFTKFGGGWGNPQEIPADIFQGAAGEDLIIKLEARIEHDYVLVKKENNSDKLAEYAKENALIDFSSLREDEEFADFMIIVGKKVFKTHRNILSARSLFFRAMFNSKMTEYQSGEVKIENHSEAAVEAMLHFIYSGNIENVPKLYEDLRDICVLADQFLMEDLKDLLEEQIIALIDLENAAIIYSDTAYMNCKRVNKFLQTFLADNLAHLELDALARKRPNLFAHIWSLKLKKKKMENSDENEEIPPEEDENSPEEDENSPEEDENSLEEDENSPEDEEVKDDE